MNAFKPGLVLGAALLGSLVGCSKSPTRTADVSDHIRASLDQAGLKDVSAGQDRDKGVVTLGGHVDGDGHKAQAESLARSLAGAELVSNQIAVIRPGPENKPRKTDSELDNGIARNLEAALIKDRMHRGVRYAVKNHVVTLTGEVDSQSKRARAGEIASTVLNVHQVVNELQVKAHRASSAN
jgi:osmotically-inducible protein OsmY